MQLHLHFSACKAKKYDKIIFARNESQNSKENGKERKKERKKEKQMKSFQPIGV